VEWCPGKDLNL